MDYVDAYIELVGKNKTFQQKIKILDSHIKSHPYLTVEAACKTGDFEIVKYLIDNNRIGNIDINELLTSTCKSNNSYLNIVEYLVSKGADPTKPDPIFYACKNGHLDIVKYLVSKGVDFNVDTKIPGHDHGENIKVAAVNDHLNVVKYLVEEGAEISTLDQALGATFSKDHMDMVNYLLIHGADINCGDGALLMKDIISKDSPMIKFIIKHGFDLSFYGKEALERAKATHDDKIIKQISEAIEEFNKPIRNTELYNTVMEAGYEELKEILGRDIIDKSPEWIQSHMDKVLRIYRKHVLVKYRSYGYLDVINTDLFNQVLGVDDVNELMDALSYSEHTRYLYQARIEWDYEGLLEDLKEELIKEYKNQGLL